MKRSDVVLQAVGLGAVAGMRAAMAPMITSHYLNTHPNPALSRTSLRFIQLPLTAAITKMLSAAELTGDKLPSTANRIEPAQLLARVASGAFVGATIFKANKLSAIDGILIGGASALVASFASFYLRKAADALPFANEPMTGAVEDAVALGTGVAVIKSR
ncbi:DUF4126 family protein [Mucilaginibacter pedocola]|uniref:DUF4126 domain-containing protein n=1 Tax=Mucilaginibacter pedocola TaxID=1792845 RepID=A0A1S9PE37_9SPHI|nr:DUF4126 family protein [Mucilaginibacter pedocola]OOQ59224.1 hypothetical protein BC343_29000 [Mucilaginibacter pedocola]